MRNEQSGGLPRYRQVSVVSIQGSTDQDYENYKYFMDHYGPVLRGVTDYNAECADKVPEEWLTLWEEAFGFFMLENYKEQVTAWVKDNKRINSAYALHGTAKRNQGYSVQEKREVTTKLRRSTIPRTTIFRSSSFQMVSP